LSGKYGVRGIPTLILLDAKTGEVINNDGRTGVMADPKGESFPWRPPALSDMLDCVYVDAQQNTYSWSDFAGKTVCLYFSAHWCGPCRMFTPSFAKFYRENAEKKDFEVIFVSSDNDEASFAEYLGEMPWKAIAFENAKGRENLGRHFEVQGIPNMVVLDSNLNVITNKGVMCLRADETGADFPWYPKPFEQLNGGTAMDLNEKPGLIVFAESNPSYIEELRAFSSALEEKNEKPAMKFFYVNMSDPIVDRVKQLMNAGVGVSMGVLDIPKQRFALYYGEEISQATIKEFYEGCLGGQVEFVTMG